MTNVGKGAETSGSSGRRVLDLHHGQAQRETAGPAGLSAAANRALLEAEARRKQQEPSEKAAVEVGGRSGLDPVRYGDWEKGGIASDF